MTDISDGNSPNCLILQQARQFHEKCRTGIFDITPFFYIYYFYFLIHWFIRTIVTWVCLILPLYDFILFFLQTGSIWAIGKNLGKEDFQRKCEVVIIWFYLCSNIFLVCKNPSEFQVHLRAYKKNKIYLNKSECDNKNSLYLLS